ERSVAVVAVEDLVAVVGDEQIGVAVVVVVAGADALAPAAAGDAGLRGDVGERAVAVVPIEMAHWCGVVRRRQAGAVDEKDVRPAVVVVVEDRDAAAGRLEDVLLGALAADDGAGLETGRRRQIAEVRNRPGNGGGLKR